MAPKAIITALTLAALAATPALADDQHHRGGRQSGNRSSDSREAAAPEARQNDRAPERAGAPRQRGPARQYRAPQYQAPREDDRARQDRAPRGYAVPRQYETRRDHVTRYDDRGIYRPRFGSARIIRPSIIEIVRYRPYRYRPRLSIGIYYGAGGSYPYGYTPPGYYDPIPGRYYGGVRITGAPRDAQVFADGYYVGIVDDFDGVFQHVNLEPGPHHIEIEAYGFEPIAFDVDVRPGQTITFRADLYRPY